MLEKVPPRDIDTEKQVIGAMLIDEQVVPVGVELLSPETFYHLRHRSIFESIKDLWINDQPVDITTVLNKLRLMKKVKALGGATYLTQLANTVAGTHNFEHHCKILRKKATLRKLIHACVNIAEDAYRDDEGVADLLDRAEATIFRVAEGDRIGDGSDNAGVLSLSSLDEYHEQDGLLHGINTGYPDIDRLTNGLHRGDLIIIAGRPSMGKTALAMNIAENVAVDQKIPVGFFSMEMSKEQLHDRVLSGRARVSGSAIYRELLPEDGFERLASGCSVLSHSKIIIDETSGLNEVELRNRARRMRAKDRIEILFVDYLQLMDGAKGENRQQEVTQISRALKGLARELNIPVVVLSQLSRQVEQRGGDKRPQLSDLRESGAIEQDADVVGFVYRESHAFGRQVNNRGEDISNAAELIIAKHRNGPVGVAKLLFMADLARFESVSRKVE